MKTKPYILGTVVERLVRPALLRLLGVACLALPLGSASAGTVVFNLNQSITPGVQLSGTAPYLQATLTDIDDNKVQFTLQATGLVQSEFVKDWFFNTTPLTNLSIQTLQGTLPVWPKLTRNPEGNADGAGWFNIELAFSQATNNGERFTSEKSYLFELVSTGTFSTSSFVPNGSAFYSVAHVGNTGTSGTDSAWVATVPEPSSAAYVIGAFCIGSCTLLRRRPIRLA